MIRIGVLLATLGIAVSASAADYERRMIPIAAGSTPGGFGTVWTTKAMAVSELFDETEIVGLVPTDFPPGFFARSVPGNAQLPASIDEPPGTILYIRKDAAPAVHVTALLEQGQAPRELTALPVVMEQEFVDHTTYFLHLTKDSSVRLHLRVYSLDLSHPAPSVRVRIQANYFPYLHPWAFVYDDTHTLFARQKMMSDMEGTISVPIRPLALELALAPLLRDIPEGAELAVSVRAASANLRVWSMVSETDNATQHVRLLLPD